MGVMKAEMEFQANGLDDLVSQTEKKIQKSGVETLQFNAGGLGKMQDRIQDSVGSGFMDGIEGTKLDSVLGGAVGAAGGVLPSGVGAGRGTSGAKKGAKSGVSGMLGAAGGAAKANPALASLSVIAGGVTALARASPIFGKVFDLLGTAVNMALMPIGNMFGEALMPFALQGIEMASNFNNMVSEDGLSVALGKMLVEGLLSLPKALMSIQTTLFSIPLEIYSGILGGIAGVLEGVGLHGLASKFENVSTFVGDIAEDIRNLPSLLEKTPGEIASKIDSFLRGGFNNLTSGIESIVGGIPGVSKPSLPLLASGGIARGPTQAVVGEAGPEAIVPLDKFEEVIDVQVDVDINDSEMLDVLRDIHKTLKSIDNEASSTQSPTRDRGTKFL